MNCEQFEDRAQQLLDNRDNLRLDLTLQQHARQCAACRHALTIYDCFHAMAGETAAVQPVQLAANSPSSSAWQRRQHRQLRHRIMVAAAALLMISLTLVTRTVTAPSTAWFVSSPEMNLASVGDSVDFSGLWAFQEQLPQVPAVDFTAISRIDLFALMPHKPA